MQQPIFITGIGTDIGKTIAAAVVTESLGAVYWKPVQAGFENGTDTTHVRSLLTNAQSAVEPEKYRLAMAASPHIAAAKEGKEINIDVIVEDAKRIQQNNRHKTLVIEGAGGLLVPLNAQEKVSDLIRELHAKVIIVSRNYLGSINHSLLTAAFCRQHDMDVLGWIFNDHYLSYESDIVAWSGYPSLGSIPRLNNIDKATIRSLAGTFHATLTAAIHD